MKLNPQSNTDFPHCNLCTIIFYYKAYNFLQFEDENNVHKYFDVENFPYDFESDKKVDSKKVTVDGKIGNCEFIEICKINIVLCAPFDYFYFCYFSLLVSPYTYIHPVYSAGVQTHNLLIMSRLLDSCHS